MINFFPILAQASRLCDPDKAGLCNPLGVEDFQHLLNDRIFTGATVLVGLVTIGMVVYSGFRFMMSQGNEEEVSKAKSALQWSLSGLVLVILAFVIVSAIQSAFQAPDITPNPGQIQNPITSPDVVTLISSIIVWALRIGGLVAILLIIISGFRYITSAGNEEQTTQAKKGLQWAIIGFVLTILAYVIVAATLRLFGHDLGTASIRVSF